MRAIERAYQWVKGLSDEQKQEMLADISATTVTIANAFKDPTITTEQVKILFESADDNEVKKVVLQDTLKEKQKELEKVQKEIDELTKQLDVLNVVTFKPVNMRVQMAEVRRRQIENMVAEGLKKQEIQKAIKEKIADIPIEQVAEIVTEKPNKKRKNTVK